MAMQQALYLADGTPVDKDTIRRAVAKRQAVIRWAHGNWHNIASLYIYDDAETAAYEAGRNTVGQCYSMWEESWSELASTVGQAIRAAAGLLKVS